MVGFIYVCLHAFRRVAQAVPPVVEMAVLDVLLSPLTAQFPGLDVIFERPKADISE